VRIFVSKGGGKDYSCFQKGVAPTVFPDVHSLRRGEILLGLGDDSQGFHRCLVEMLSSC
jgi:hypothetical protein